MPNHITPYHLDRYKCLAVSWTSKGGNVHGFGESSKEFRLIIGVDVSVYDHYGEGFTGLYGDRVIVEASEQVVLTDDSLGADAIGDISGVDVAEVGRTPIVPVDISVALAGSAFFAATSAPDNSYWLWMVLGIGVLVSLLMFLWLRTHPVPAMQIANGTTVIESGRLRIKQVKALVKDSADAPRSDLFDSIIHKINITKGEYTK